MDPALLHQSHPPLLAAAFFAAALVLAAVLAAALVAALVLASLVAALVLASLVAALVLAALVLPASTVPVLSLAGAAAVRPLPLRFPVPCLPSPNGLLSLLEPCSQSAHVTILSVPAPKSSPTT